MDTFSVHFFPTANVLQQHLWSSDTPSYRPVLMGIHLKCQRQTSQFLCKINPHLAGCMPRQKTGLTLISSWRALASSSLCTLPKLLGQPLCVNLWESTRTQVSMNYEHNKDSQRYTWLPDLNRSSRVLPARDLLCLAPGRRAWEEAWILLSICREGSTPVKGWHQNGHDVHYCTDCMSVKKSYYCL